VALVASDGISAADKGGTRGGGERRGSGRKEDAGRRLVSFTAAGPAVPRLMRRGMRARGGTERASNQARPIARSTPNPKA
jgi:hypothetical protein